MSDYFIEKITYDEIAGMGYIYLVEPLKFEITYTEELPENPDVNLDLGNDVPIIGVELGGKSAKKIMALKDEDKVFRKVTAENGKDFFSFMLENKPIKKSVSYNSIEEIRFHFADDNCMDFIGIDIYSENPYYHQYLDDK